MVKHQANLSVVASPSSGPTLHLQPSVWSWAAAAAAASQGKLHVYGRGTATSHAIQRATGRVRDGESEAAAAAIMWGRLSRFPYWMGSQVLQLPRATHFFAVFFLSLRVSEDVL